MISKKQVESDALVAKRTACCFGKLMMIATPNVLLIMDEPTNHLDMESIEALNTGLEKFPGTLVFVSHDREFVSSLATRVLEVKGDGGSSTTWAATRTTWPASASAEGARQVSRRSAMTGSPKRSPSR